MIHKPLFFKILLIFAAVTLLSFLAFQSPALNRASFVFILAVVAALASRSLLYGVMALFGELLISSQGHLFDLYLNNFRFSLRMGLFAVILVVWGLPRIKKFLQKPREFIFSLRKSKLISDYLIYGIFALIILFGIANGILRHNSSSYIFQDANGYFFFALLPVFISAIREYEKNARGAEEHQLTAHTLILTIWAAGIVFQAIATAVLLFLYGHLDIFWRILVPIYQWFRDQRIFEVGAYKYNFYRVFLQSGIFALTGFVTFAGLWLFQETRKIIRPYSFILTSAIFALLVSLSRSFWIAGVSGVLFLVALYITLARPPLSVLGARALQGMILAGMSLGLIAILLLIPIGKIPGLSALASIPDRATETDESALSSRWSLMPVLIQAISKRIFFGSGFGATVTYKTSDPRYLAAHPNNPYYTTFAFEWGWLDLWYKIGLFGLFAYLTLVCSIIMRGVKILKKNSADLQNPTTRGMYTGLLVGVVVIVVVHFFTPFLNHPLGIGYLMLADGMFRKS